MSTSNNAPAPVTAAVTEMRVAIVRTLWNSHITLSLLDGAVKELKSNGLSDKDIDIFEVPGAIELTHAASALVETGLYNAIIELGCVIRGGTPHFDYVCQSVTQGMTQLNADVDIPVIFGVLTVDNEQDALDRAGGKLGNKGAEAAQAALIMHNFAQRVASL